MKTLRSALVTVSLLFAAVAANGATIALVNGDFENPLVGGNFNTYYGPNNTTSLPGWTINGSIDQIGNYWQPASGHQSLDMAGDFPGSISQDITLPGYGNTFVNFDMAGNPDGGPTIKHLEVSLISGGGSQIFTFDISNPGISKVNMGWVSETANFGNLPAGTYTLQFACLDAGPYGPALDDVSVTVPDGGLTVGMLGMGLVGIGLLRKKLS